MFKRIVLSDIIKIILKPENSSMFDNMNINSKNL